MRNNTTNTDLPPVPEGYHLYGRGPLPFPPALPTSDILGCFHGDGPWTPGWRGGSDIHYFALRIGSEVWARNCGEALDGLRRRTAVEAEGAAQRIIALEAECARLHNLWYEAQVKVDALEAEKKAMIEAKGFIVVGPSDDLSEVSKLVCERYNWEQTAAQHLRNEEFCRGLLGQCAELLGDECRRCDDGRMIPADDFLALKVPEVLKERLESAADLKEAFCNQSDAFNKRTLLGHSLFGGGAEFGGALCIGQDVVLDGMRWMRDEILRLRRNEAAVLDGFPKNQWALCVSDGYVVFRWTFPPETRGDLCIDSIKCLVEAFLQSKAGTEERLGLI